MERERVKTTRSFRRTASLAPVQPPLLDPASTHLPGALASTISPRRLKASLARDACASPTKAKSLSVQNARSFISDSEPYMLNQQAKPGVIPSTRTFLQPTDRIGAAYSPASAGLQANRAFVLAAGLNFRGAMPYKSGQAALKKQRSLRLSKSSELRRAQEKAEKREERWRKKKKGENCFSYSRSSFS